MNSCSCPQCHCNIHITKNGRTSAGRLRYHCHICGANWTRSARKARLEDKVFRLYTLDGLPAYRVADICNLGIGTVRRIIRQYEVSCINPTPYASEVKVAILDATYFGRNTGFLVGIEPGSLRPLYLDTISRHERVIDYEIALITMLECNIRLRAVVIDGSIGVSKMFERYGIIVQRCMFHQKQTIRRYITSKPKLPANQDLKRIVDRLAQYEDDIELLVELGLWYGKYKDWLKERKYTEDGKHWHYVHKKTRSAFRSLVHNAKYLYNYKKHPELNIPNTSNAIEGTFSIIKDRLRQHRGCNLTLKKKMFTYLLKQRIYGKRDNQK